MGDSSQRMVTYGYSSGGGRAHILFRSENGKLFLVFKTADRGERVYYLRKDLLYDVFEDHEDEIPEFDEHATEEDEIPEFDEHATEEDEIPEFDEHATEEDEIPEFDEHATEEDLLPPDIMSRSYSCA